MIHSNVNPIIDLAKKQLGWTPAVALENGLEPTITYFKELLNP